MLTRPRDRSNLLLRGLGDGPEADRPRLLPVARPEPPQLGIRPVERQSSARSLVPAVAVGVLRDLGANELVLLVVLLGHLLEHRVVRRERVEVLVLGCGQRVAAAAAAV